MRRQPRKFLTVRREQPEEYLGSWSRLDFLLRRVATAIGFIDWWRDKNMGTADMPDDFDALFEDVASKIEMIIEMTQTAIKQAEPEVDWIIKTKSKDFNLIESLLDRLTTPLWPINIKKDVQNASFNDLPVMVSLLTLASNKMHPLGAFYQ